MTSTVKATRQFSADFSLVSRHYHCTPAEIAEMKQCAREHMDDAVACFASLAHEALAAV